MDTEVSACSEAGCHFGVFENSLTCGCSRQLSSHQPQGSMWCFFNEHLVSDLGRGTRSPL